MSIIYLDVEPTIKYLLKKVDEEQNKLFHTSIHIGPYLPINKYVRVYDTFIRMMLLYDDLKKELLSRFENIEDIRLFSGDLSFLQSKFSKPKAYYDTCYTKRRLTHEDLVFQIRTVVREYSFHYTCFHETSRPMFEFANEYYQLNEIEELKGHLNYQDRCKLVKKLLYYLTLPQTQLNNMEFVFIFNLFVIINFNGEIETNENMLYRNKYFSTKRLPKVNTEIYNFKFVCFQELRKRLLPYGIIEPKLVHITETRTFKSVCDAANGKVLVFDDDNVIAVMYKYLQLYKTKTYSKIMSTCDFKCVFRGAEFIQFHSVFIRILKLFEMKTANAIKPYLRYR